MTYADIIEWIERNFDSERYDLFSFKDLQDFRHQLARDLDKGDGRIRHFIEGNPNMTKYMIDQGRARWTGIDIPTRLDEFTNEDTAEYQFFNRVERPILEELNRKAEQEVLDQLGDADTTDEIGDIDIPDLLPETKERLEGSKTERFGIVKGIELRREIESPDTEASRFKQLIKEVKKLPDEDIGRELKKEIKEEGKRLWELNQFFLQEIRGAGSEAELGNVLTRLEDSDLRNRQKDALRRIAESRRGLGFPEIGEI